MRKYIIKRILMMIPVLIGITFLVFSIMQMTPGTPGRVILGQMATEEEVEQLNEELGYNRPFMVRYASYLFDLCRLDLGSSYSTGIPVVDSIAERFPVTLALSVFSMIVTIIISIPLGILSAVKQYSFMDGFSVFISIILAAMPQFWLGLILIIIFALNWHLLPATGVETLSSYILPTITASASTTAVVTRMTRTTMLGVLREDYIRSAKAKGASEKRIIIKHALRNTLIPVVTVLGTNFGTLLGSTVLVETVFGMPGIGNFLVSAIRGKDEPVVLGCVSCLAVCFSLVNLLVDISYGYIDPRIKK